MEKLLLGRLSFIENRNESYLFEKVNYGTKEVECYVTYGSLEDLKDEVEIVIDNFKRKDVYMVSFEIKDKVLKIQFNDDGDEVELIVRHDNQIQR